MKKLLVILLVLVMLLPMVVACDKTPDKPVEQETITVDKNDDIGDYNFGGEPFTILVREETLYEFEPNEGVSGDTVSSGVYYRNLEVEERFHTALDLIPVEGRWDKRVEFMTKVRSEYMGGGTSGIDLIAGHSVLLSYLIPEGLCADMATLPEIDFTKSYWSKNLYEDINIGGRVYMMIGDIGMTLYENMQVMFVNTKPYEDYFSGEGGIDALYAMVNEGKWTYEKMYEIADRFGNGEEDGKYGYVANAHSWRASFYAQESSIYLKDTDGYYYAPEQMPEKLFNVIEKMVTEFDKDNIRFELGNWTHEATTITPWFISGNVLFYPQILGEAKNLVQGMETQFHVLPLPKYDEFQEQYRTICMNDLTAVMVPTFGDNMEMSGVLTQAMCMLSQKHITPEIYNKNLQTRFQHDNRSQQMIELSRQGLAYSAAETFVGESGFKIDSFHLIVKNGLNTAASEYASGAPSGQKILDNFYAAVEMLNMQ